MPSQARALLSELLQYFILFESFKHIDCSRLFENNPLREAGGAAGPTIGMAVQRSCRVGTIATITSPQARPRLLLSARPSPGLHEVWVTVFSLYNRPLKRRSGRAK